MMILSHFYLEGKKDDDNCMRMLVNTGTVINTGNLKYHLWVTLHYLEMVEEYLQCKEGTKYEVT